MGSGDFCYGVFSWSSVVISKYCMWYRGIWLFSSICRFVGLLRFVLLLGILLDRRCRLLRCMFLLVHCLGGMCLCRLCSWCILLGYGHRCLLGGWFVFVVRCFCLLSLVVMLL